MSGFKIRSISPAGAVSTLAGAGTIGLDDGATSSARFWTPRGVAVSASGSVYVADAGTSRIREIASGQVSTFGGSSGGFLDGTGPGAKFKLPFDLVVDGSGNLFVADTGNRVIRNITPDRVVSLYAGVVSTTADFADGATDSAKFGSYTVTP